MTDSLNNDRILFVSQIERELFWNKILKQTDIATVAQHCNCSDRTVRDWRRGVYLAPYTAIEKLCKKYSVTLTPKLYTRISERSLKRLAGQKGGRATITKYKRVPVREEARKQAWQQWWKIVGQYKTNKVTNAQPISIPERTPKLAECVGILLGDGTIAPYHIAVFLNTERDKEYIQYVTKPLYKLFAVQPKIYPHATRLVTAITVARKELVMYFMSLGLPQGDKIRNGARIPDWIKRDKTLLTACVRGLFDTDGSVYLHTYTRNNKQYEYVKVNFSSGSALLCRDVSFALRALAIQHSVYPKLIAIESQAAVRTFSHIVGSNNPKHLKRLPE